MQIMELVEAQFDAKAFSRSKLVKSVCDALILAKEDVTRGVKAQVCNAVDSYAKQQLEAVKVTNYVSTRIKTVLGNGNDGQHLREQFSTLANTGREFTPSESVIELMRMVNEKRCAFLKEPSEARIKSYYNYRRRAYLACFDLEQTCITEDVEQARVAKERINNWSVEIRAIGVEV